MAAATLAQIRPALKALLASISGLQTYAYLPALPDLPCAFVGAPRDVLYHAAMQSGLNEWTFSVWALVSNATPTEESQAQLDLFVSPNGTKSIKAALETTTGLPQTLTGVVDDVVVDGCSGYSMYVTENGSYFGAEFTVRVLAGT